MATIIPRWEWRTFGTHFGGAVAKIEATGTTGTADSDETYLLVTAAGDAPSAIVKVRFDLMDIKLLREVDANGLERWEPVLKVGFPMPAADVERVIEALSLPAAALARDAYTLEQFLGEVAGPSGMVRPVEVHKHRVRYTVGGCSSEVSDVVANGKTTRTIAIESEDAAAVVAAVGSVGLDGYANTNYPRGLAALLDGLPERYAVIDVGTNSIKFQVAELGADGRFHAIVDRAEVTRLGQGVDAGGEIVQEALERAIVAIAGMADEAKALGVTATAAVGTAGLRAAGNREAVAGRDQGPHRRGRSGSSPARRRAGSPSRRSRSGLARPWGASSSLTPAVAARSSPSATTATSTSSTASRSGPCASPSGSAWPVP